MTGVIDTSALIRLFVPDGPVLDGLEAFLRGVERGNNRAVAPDLLLIESANVLNKKRTSGELSDEEACALLEDVLAMPIRIIEHGPLVPSAFELAGEHRITVYDALYLALALDLGAVLFTSDNDLRQIADALGVQ